VEVCDTPKFDASQLLSDVFKFTSTDRVSYPKDIKIIRLHFSLLSSVKSMRTVRSTKGEVEN